MPWRRSRDVHVGQVTSVKEKVEALSASGRWAVYTNKAASAEFAAKPAVAGQKLTRSLCV